MRKIAKNHMLLYGAIICTILLFSSATVVAQTHGAIAATQIKQANKIQSAKEKLTNERIGDQKTYTRMLSKLRQLITSKAFKNYQSKIRTMLEQKYGTMLYSKCRNICG